MTKPILIYSIGIACAAFALQWLEYKYAVRMFSTEFYFVIIALIFTALGIWVGNRLTARNRPRPFQKNQRAIDYLGLSPSEQKVLALLAKGLSNAEIAGRIHVSINTVKSHLGNLYAKLEVSRRTQAVHKARSLKIVE